MTIRIIIGNAQTELTNMPAESVHCCVTSPPYYGLRDYGTAMWEDGDAACDHVERHPSRGRSTLTSAGVGQTDAGSAYQAQKRQYRDQCPCGARRIDAQLGIEATPDAYIAALVAVFREVRRVLRRDGTLWLNIGDSYAGGGGFSPNAPSNLAGAKQTTQGGAKSGGIAVGNGVKAKDLVGIPWMLAFALRADGWYLRQDIIWAKPNPMPESVTDRCTKAHEYLFLMSKSERYWFDAAAIAEASITPELKVGGIGKSWHDHQDDLVRGDRKTVPGTNGQHQSFPEGRNKRSVWTIATAPFPQAHFATFPPALVEPCILAGCPRGGTVLDCFLGAGTTALVADRLGRNAIGIELNLAYANMARNRIADDAGLFFEAAE